MSESKHGQGSAAGVHPYFLGAEPFVCATYAAQPCGCQIVGAGVIPSPLDIKRCATHETALRMLESLQVGDGDTFAGTLEAVANTLVVAGLAGHGRTVDWLRNKAAAIRAAIAAATGGEQ